MGDALMDGLSDAGSIPARSILENREISWRDKDFTVFLYACPLPCQKKKPLKKSEVSDMEHMGFEPTASTMRMLRAPNCANAP